VDLELGERHVGSFDEILGDGVANISFQGVFVKHLRGEEGEINERPPEEKSGERGKYQVFHLEHGLIGDVVLQEDLVSLKSEIGLAILLQEVEEGIIAVVERKVHSSQELAQGAQWH